VSITRRKQSLDSNEGINDNGSAASFLSVIPRNCTTVNLGASPVRTHIEAGLAGGSLNPDAGATADDRRTIELPAGQSFYNSAGETEVAEGYDMILVTYTGGLSAREDEVYVITELDPDGDNLVDPGPRRCRVRTLNGGVAGFPTGVATTDVTFTFVKNHFQQGGGTAFYRSVFDGVSDFVNFDTMYHAVPPPITDPNAGAGEILPFAPQFVAAAISSDDSEAYGYNGTTPSALLWGGFDSRRRTNHSTPALAGNQVRLRGGLRGDGSINAQYYSQRERRVTLDSGDLTPTVTWNPNLDGGTLVLLLNQTFGDKLDITVTMDPATVIEIGTRLIVFVHWFNGLGLGDDPANPTDVDITWPSVDPITASNTCTFMFGTPGGVSLVGDAVPGKEPGSTTMWVGHASSNFSTGAPSDMKVYFTRSIYQA